MSCLALSLCECGACLACSCFSKVLSGVLSQAARLGHALLLTVIFGFAAIMGSEYPNNVNGYGSYTKVNVGENCYSGYEDTCIYRQLIYRASFAMFLVFGVLAFACLFSDHANKSMWPFKFMASLALFIGGQYSL